MTHWKPLSEERLLELVNSARQRMNPAEKRFWDAISTPPKWPAGSKDFPTRVS